MMKSSPAPVPVPASELRAWLEARARERLLAGLPWLSSELAAEAKQRRAALADATFFAPLALEGAKQTLPLLELEEELLAKAREQAEAGAWLEASSSLRELALQASLTRPELQPSLELAASLGAAAAGRLEPLEAAEALEEALEEPSHELEAVEAFFAYAEPVVRGSRGELESLCDAEEGGGEAPAGPLFAEDGCF